MTEQKNQSQNQTFHSVDGIYAILSFIFGFFFLKYTFAVTPGIALTVISGGLIAITLLYAALRKVKLTAASLLWAGIIFLFSLVYAITANGFLKGWCVVFELIAVAYWIYLTFGNRTSKTVDEMLGFDLLKSLFILPFGHGHNVFAAFGAMGKQRKTSQTILYILLGLGIALVPSAMVFSLLEDGDSYFSNLVDYLFSDLETILDNNIGSLIFAVPAGMLLFGLWHGAAEQKFTTVLSRRSKDQITQVIRFASPVITCAALTPMLVIYILFFIAQAGYFLGAFENLRPEGYTYAEYAREGFFNLVVVCVINAIIILAVHFFTKRTGKKGYSVPAKIYVILFSLTSIFLAVIALRKMAMYIDQYGLTLSRVYASWFIILLSVFFLILIIKQFAHKLNALFCALMAFLLLFGGLCLCNVDARIAEYNIQRHLQRLEAGDESELDFTMFYEDLSDAAILAVHEAYDDLDEEARKNADEYFNQCAQSMALRLKQNYSYVDQYSFRSWNLDTFRAAEILAERCPEIFEDLPSPYGWTW